MNVHTTLQLLLILIACPCIALLHACNDADQPKDDAPKSEISEAGTSRTPMSDTTDPTDVATKYEFRTPTNPSDAFDVSFAHLEGDRFPTNEPCQLIVRAVSADGKPLSENHALNVDGAMPHHGHGLVRRPTINRIDDTTWEVSGLLLHMPGRWEIYIDITHAGMTERSHHVEELR